MGAEAFVLRDQFLLEIICQFQFGLPQELVEIVHLADLIVITPCLTEASRTSAYLNNIPSRFIHTLYLGQFENIVCLPSCELILENNYNEPTLPLHLSIIENNVHHIVMWIKHKPEWLSPSPLKLAALCGNFEIVKALMNATKNTWTSEAMDLAARNGYLEIVKWIHELKDGPKCTTNAMDGAATNGHLEVVKYLNEQRTEGCTTKALFGAVRNGYSKVVEYLFNHRPEEYTRASYFYAEYYRYRYHRAAKEKDYLGVLKCLRSHGIDHIDENSINVAIRADPLPIFQYMYQNNFVGMTKLMMDEIIKIGDKNAIRFAIEAILEDNNKPISLLDIDENGVETWTPIDNPFFTTRTYRFNNQWSISKAIDIAAGLGDFNTVILLHRSGINCCSVKAMDTASAIGRLDIVQWLYTHRNEGCSENAMSYAAAQGHLNIVKWLHEVGGLDCTADGLSTAAYNGDYATVSYLLSIALSSKCSLIFTSHRHIDFPGNRIIICLDDPISAAACNGHLNIIKLLHNYSSSKRAIGSAIENGHLDVVKYLFAVRKQHCHASAYKKAVRSNRLDILKYLVTNNCSRRTINYEKLCIEASGTNNLDMVVFCMNQLQTDLKKKSKQLMMYRAAEHGHLNIVQWLHESKGFGWTLPMKEVAHERNRKKIIAYFDLISDPEIDVTDVDDENLQISDMSLN
ncbi:hypothetical protein THRCLA_21967 [Thraustotheca clavata]|uniref:Uncharacterized protein n=1 Tax=Thraustotheca clavata TaxID=74557 RepID=A0A1V9ZGQ6_9STRA|nr:hypothetical protein THRCLA_21967 [Thraustotheca clavata]